MSTRIISQFQSGISSADLNEKYKELFRKNNGNPNWIISYASSNFITYSSPTITIHGDITSMKLFIGGAYITMSDTLVISNVTDGYYLHFVYNHNAKTLTLVAYSTIQVDDNMLAFAQWHTSGGATLLSDAITKFSGSGLGSIILTPDMSNFIAGTNATKVADTNAQKGQRIQITNTSASQVMATVTCAPGSLPLGKYSLNIRMGCSNNAITGNSVSVSIFMGNTSTFTNQLSATKNFDNTVFPSSDYDCFYVPFDYKLGGKVMSSNDTIQVVVNALGNAAGTYTLYLDYVAIQSSVIGLAG